MNEGNEILEEDRNIKRMNRQKYFYENVKVFAVICLLLFLSMIFGSFFAMISIFAILASCGYGLYLSACRLHDLALSALWIIPVIAINSIFTFGLNMPGLTQLSNFIVTLLLLFVKGTEGPNKYGDDPLQAAPKYVYDNEDVNHKEKIN